MDTPPPPPTGRKLTPWKGFASVFLAVFLVVFLSGALITFMLPESYAAVARVRVISPELREHIASDEVLLRAAEETGLRRYLTEQYAESQPLSDERLLQAIRRSVQVRPIPRTDIVEIRAYSLSPRGAADLANTIAKDAQRAGSPSPPAGRIQIIETAVPPRQPARPNKPLNLFLSAAVGIVLGVMAGGVGARLAVGYDRTPQ